MFETEQTKSEKKGPPFEVMDNAKWEGLKLSIKSESLSEKERKEIRQFGLENAMIAHHRPSGKLIISSSKEFAAGLFSKSQSLRQTLFSLPKPKDFRSKVLPSHIYRLF